MTCREKLKIEHPICVNSDYTGGCSGCPDDYGYAECPAYCYGGSRDSCTKCWDREIPENDTPETDNKPEDSKDKGRAIEIVYTDGSHDLLYGVKNFELIRDARMFNIEHVDSDIHTLIPAEHVIRIGKIWNGKDIH